MLLRNAKVCKNMLKLLGRNDDDTTSHDISFLGGIRKSDGTYINTIYNTVSWYCMGSMYNRYFDYVYPNSFSPLGTNTTDYATFNIQLGSGNTTPTENDYNLASAYSLNTNFKLLTKSSAVTVKGDNSGAIFTVEQHLQAVTDLSISELGLSNAVHAQRGGGSGTFQHILLTRDVLTTPLIVTAGQGFTLRVSVEQPFSEI